MQQAGEEAEIRRLPVDIAVFESDKHLADYRHLLFFVECKQPGISSGLQQLEIYLGLEPFVSLPRTGSDRHDAGQVLHGAVKAGSVFAPRRHVARDDQAVGEICIRCAAAGKR